MGDESPLPKQELLIKLLKMTTSDTDGEALAAIRRANSLLASAGWDWQKLIEGKIKVVEDPFKFAAAPERMPVGTAPPPPRAPQPPPPPRPTPKRVVGTPTSPISTMPNRFAGHCHCCGIECVTNAGFIFKRTTAQPKWDVVCATCNTSAVVYDWAATPIRQKRKKSIVDLA